MKSIAKLLLLLSVFAIGLSACSKEKRIERQLIKKEGKWKITSIDYKYYVNNNLQQSSNYPNAGTIEFNKNGTFVMTITVDGSPEVFGGNWTNSKDEVTLISDGEASILKITDGPKKDKMVLEGTEYNNGTGEKDVYTYYLERAD
ncbi:hypothetical protein [Fluviicola sp.]|uniref:hypothetical protein n=1 Tax=Fluviicola sp. TaxID=1917219 RepID=UPI003D2B0431